MRASRKRVHVESKASGGSQFEKVANARDWFAKRCKRKAEIVGLFVYSVKKSLVEFSSYGVTSRQLGRLLQVVVRQLMECLSPKKQRSSEQLRDYPNARHDLPDAYGIDRESRHVAGDRRGWASNHPSNTLTAFATAIARMAGLEHQSGVKGEASFAQCLSRKLQ